jgi:hypothetical protein
MPSRDTILPGGLQLHNPTLPAGDRKFIRPWIATRFPTGTMRICDSCLGSS